MSSGTSAMGLMGPLQVVYANLRKEFEEKKEEHNMKIRLVILAKGVQSLELAFTNLDDLQVTYRNILNISPVADFHGNGIYTRC